MIYSGAREYPEERQARIAIIPWILLSLGWALLAGALLFLALTGRKVPSEPLTKIVTEKVNVNVPGPATVTVVGENGAIGNLPGTGSTVSTGNKAQASRSTTRSGGIGSSGSGRVVDDMCPCRCPTSTGTVSVSVPGVTSASVKTPALPVPTPSLPSVPGTSVPKVP